MLLSRLVGTELLGDRQAALCSVCIVGFYASVRLMVSWRHLVGDGDGIDDMARIYCKNLGLESLERKTCKGKVCFLQEHDVEADGIGLNNRLCGS